MDAEEMTRTVWDILEKDKDSHVDATLTGIDCNPTHTTASFYIRTLDGTFKLTIHRVDR